MNYERFAGDENKQELQLGSYERIRRLVEILPEVVFEVDLNGKLVFANKMGYEISGRTDEEVKNLTIVEMLVPEDRQRAAENIARVLNGEENIPHDYTVLQPNGVKIPVCIRSIPNYVDGKLVGFFGILMDNRHRIESERKLRESEQKFRYLVEQSPDLVIRFNSRLEIQYLNPALERFTGMKFEEIIGKTLAGIGTSAEAAGHWEISLDNVFSSGESKQFVLGGSWQEKYFDIRLIPEIDEDDKVRTVLSIARDITNIRLSEQKRLESEERYHHLFNTMLDSFALYKVICDVEGKPADYLFLEINPAFEEFVGKGADEIVGKLLSEFNPKNFKHWFEVYGKVTLPGESLRLDYFSDQLDKHLDIIVYCPAEKQLAMIIRDITERKRLEENLAQTVKMEAIGQLAGGIAHDFNNVLMGILGYASLLKGQPENVEFVKKAAETIEKSGKRASDLVKNLLGFARKGKNQVISVDIHSLIDEVIDLVSRLIEKKVRINKFFDAERAVILGDPSQIQQVLLNLLLNARDAMPDGGEINIRTKEIYLSKNVCPVDMEIGEGWYIEVSTTDNGDGIPEEIKDRVFEPFFTTKGKGQGSGMGLAMAYGVIKNHDGLIKIESQPGSGTTVKFALRLAETNIEKLHITSDSNSSGGQPNRNLKVLIVDDDEISLQVSQMMFEKTGCKVETASDGKAALKMFNRGSKKYDLVIVDMEMPVMQGDELFDRLKELNPDVQVIIISGYAINEKSQSVLDRGARGFIHKPFQIQDIEKLIARLALN